MVLTECGVRVIRKLKSDKKMTVEIIWVQNDYLKDGRGNPWAGHSISNSNPALFKMRIPSALKAKFGALDPIGSIHIKKFPVLKIILRGEHWMLIGMEGLVNVSANIHSHMGWVGSSILELIQFYTIHNLQQEKPIWVYRSLTLRPILRWNEPYSSSVQ